MTDKAPIGRQGGLARKEALTPEQLKAQAQHAAAKRWGKPLVATNKGNFLEDFGVDVDCYVLDDATRTPVISQRGMGPAIGFSRRGSRLKVFVNSKTMDEYIGRDLREKIENPLIFQTPGAAATSPVSAVAHGYEASILIDICNAISAAKADGKLSGPRYEKMVERARVITSASAKNGIRGLIYALAGYNPSADEVIRAFKLYVLEEAKKYEKEFPRELYDAWQKLYQIKPIQGRGRPWEFMHLTVNHIYHPLAQSNGKLLELLRALKAKGGDRRTKLFQFLNEVGARALRMQIGRVLEMAEDSRDTVEYEARIKRRFAIQREFDFSNTSDEVAEAT